jgi:hypothetical protein
MKRVSAPGYDLFKTIIAILLAIILILMLLRGCATNPIAPAAPAAASSPDAAALPATAMATQTLPAASPSETQTAVPASPTPEPTLTPTTVAATPTATPAVTEATPAEPEPVTATPAQNGSCDTSVPSRLTIGQKARLLQRLNLRMDASIQAPIIQTNPFNTQVEIIGGPVCTPVGSGAYLWWQIRLASGAEGWSAESALNQASYFLEPLP